MGRKAKVCFTCDGRGRIHLETCITMRALDAGCDCAGVKFHCFDDRGPTGHVCEDCGGTGRRGRHVKSEEPF